MSLTFSYVKPMLLANLKAGLTPALLGEPGIGKTAFLEDLANELDTKVFVLSVNQLAAKEDLTGARLVHTEDNKDYEQKFYPHQVIREAIAYANEHPDETPILFMDEFNRTESDVTSALFTMITERKIGNRDLPSNLRLAVAGNDAGNVQSVDDASTSRLSVWHVIPDLETLLATTKLNVYVKQTLQSHPDLNLVEHEKKNHMKANSDDDWDHDEEDTANDMKDFMEQLQQNEVSFKQMTTPRTIENLSKELDALSLTGSANDSDVIEKLLSDNASFREMMYGISGNTQFTNAVIDTLTEVISNATTTIPGGQQIDTTVKTKLTKSDKDLLHGLFDGISDGNVVIDNVMDLDADSATTLFELLLAPKLAEELTKESIISGAQVYAIQALNKYIEESDDSKNLKRKFAQILMKYTNSKDGVNRNANTALMGLEETDPLGEVYSMLVG